MVSKAQRRLAYPLISTADIVAHGYIYIWMRPTARIRSKLDMFS